MKFVQEASKKVVNMAQVVKENSTDNSLKFSGVKNKTFRVYFPKRMVQEEQEDGTVVTVPRINAISAGVHEFTDLNGRYMSFVCMDGKVMKDDDGNIVYDGTCPFCNFENQKASWDIFKYRKELAEATQTVGMTEDAKEKHMKSVSSDLNKQRKVKEKTNFVYVLAAVFVTDENNKVVTENGKPVYEFKVIKWRDAKAEEIEKKFPNYGVNMAGGEAKFEYGGEDDRMQLAKNVQINVMIDNPTANVFNTVTGQVPGLADEIDKAAEKFDWEALGSAFGEWKLSSTAYQNGLVEESLAEWKKYLKEKEINPNARYLEYSSKDETPALQGVGGWAPVSETEKLLAGATAENAGEAVQQSGMFAGFNLGAN